MTRTVTTLYTSLFLSLFGSACVGGDDCRHTADREATLDAAGATRLQVLAEAGSLEIVGRPNLSEVRVSGTACASRRDDLDRIRIETDAAGDRLRVEADLPSDLFGWNRQARLDLRLEVPQHLALEVEDGSGWTAVDNVASLRLVDGSGSIDVERIAGEVWLKDGSGGIEVRGAGRVEIREDGSGGIDVRQVRGDVDVVEDGSGSIVVEEVGGNLRIGRDGSGGIRVAEVAGDFTLEHDGSGGVDVGRVDGEVRLP